MTQNEKENLTDESDRATRTEMEFTQDSIDATRNRARPQQSACADGTFAVTDCEDCGEQIGEARLKVAAMNLLCVHCADFKEKVARRFQR